MLRVPLHADWQTVLIHACVVGGVVAVLGLVVAGCLVGYAIWILQRISNLFRVNLYTRMQELSVRFHSEEKIGDAIFRMFQDSAAIPNVIDGLIVQPVIFFPAAIGAMLYLLWYDTRLALIVALLMPANFILAWIYANSLRAAFIGEREATALATTRIEETLASIMPVKAFGTEALEANHFAQDNWSAFLQAGARPDARALPRRHQHRSRIGVRRGDVRWRDGGNRRRRRRPRTRRRFARTVPGLDHAGLQRQQAHAKYHRPMGQYAGRRGRDFARARDAR